MPEALPPRPTSTKSNQETKYVDKYNLVTLAKLGVIPSSDNKEAYSPSSLYKNMQLKLGAIKECYDQTTAEFNHAINLLRDKVKQLEATTDFYFNRLNMPTVDDLDHSKQIGGRPTLEDASLLRDELDHCKILANKASDAAKNRTFFEGVMFKMEQDFNIQHPSGVTGAIQYNLPENDIESLNKSINSIMIKCDPTID